MPPALGRGKELPKMKLLATVRHINDALRLKGLGPVLNRG